MKTQHTPGPWHVQPIGSERYVEANGPVMICDMQRNERTNPEEIAVCDADARLIAAAPELLEALQALYAAGKNQRTIADEKLVGNTYAKARAAINKATGHAV